MEITKYKTDGIGTLVARCHIDSFSGYDIRIIPPIGTGKAIWGIYDDERRIVGGLAKTVRSAKLAVRKWLTT